MEALEAARVRAPSPTEEAEDDGTGPLPEEKLNKMIRWTASLYSAMQGFGKLALMWATVVLLGGFAVLMKQIDFWFVTIIVFIQAASIFSRSEKPEDQFFLRVPRSFERKSYGKLYEECKRTVYYYRSSGQHRYDEEPGLQLSSFLNLKFSSCRYFMMGIRDTAHSYEQLAAAIICMVLSAIRLIEQDYVEPTYKSAVDHKNIQASLNIFYSLALAQGLSYFLMGMFASPIKQMVTICLKYKLGTWGIAILYRYVKDNYMKCINGDARDTGDMSLVSYVMELANSDSDEDQLMGVCTLDHLLKREAYRQRVLVRLRASTETVGSVISMLGFKSPWKQQTRIHAASIVLELAPHISVESFPGMLQLISLLIMPSSGNFFYPNSVKTELTRFGIQIVDKLANDLDNRKKVKDIDQLLSKMIDLTDLADVEIKIEVVETSVKLLHKLVSTTGETGRVIRRDVTENVNILRNIRIILENPKSQAELVVPAIGILACLAADETARQDLGSLRQIIKKLVCFLFDPAQSVQVRYNLITTTQAAAEALFLISVDDESKVSTILAELELKGIEHLVNMLFNESGKHRRPIAKLLQNLRAYRGQGDVLNNLDKALPKVLEAIKLGVEKLEGPESPDGHAAHVSEVVSAEEGKLLEGLIGLSVQICTYGKAIDFSNLTADIFVQKLKKILEVYKSPTAEFPGIRRFTVELITCMMKKNSSYVEVFRRHGMVKAIEEVKETPMRLESFKICYCGVGVFKHDDHISSVASKSLALMNGDSEQGTE